MAMKNLQKYNAIDSYRFISTLLVLNLVHNLSGEAHNDKCTDCKSYLDCMTIKDEQ